MHGKCVPSVLLRMLCTSYTQPSNQQDQHREVGISYHNIDKDFDIEAVMKCSVEDIMYNHGVFEEDAKWKFAVKTKGYPKGKLCTYLRTYSNIK